MVRADQIKSNVAKAKGYKFSNKRAKEKVKENPIKVIYDNIVLNSIRPNDEANLDKHDSIFFPDMSNLLYIVNVVGSYQLGVGFNPKKNALFIRHLAIKYYAATFAANTIIAQRPNIYKTTVHLFGTGKVVQTGALTKEHCIAAARAFELKIISEFKCPYICLKDFKITNMVGTFQISDPIDIMELKDNLGILGKLTVRKFPACRMRLKPRDSKVCLVFNSGMLVFTGFRTKEEFMLHVVAFCKIIIPFCKVRLAKQVSKTEHRKMDKEKYINSKMISKLNSKIKRLGAGGMVEKKPARAGLTFMPALEYNKAG